MYVYLSSKEKQNLLPELFHNFKIAFQNKTLSFDLWKSRTSVKTNYKFTMSGSLKHNLTTPVIVKGIANKYDSVTPHHGTVKYQVYLNLTLWKDWAKLQQGAIKIFVCLTE